MIELESENIVEYDQLLLQFYYHHLHFLVHLMNQMKTIEEPKINSIPKQKTIVL
jgi:hypothetical protein